MNTLLIYPTFPKTYWTFHYALRFLGKKAALPPLGLLTVASLLPKSWNLRLIDMNVTRLTDKDIAWADMVMVSAMVVQQDSAREVMARAKAMGKIVVAGGPLFTCEPDKFPGVDHLILGEAEAVLPEFLGDLERGEARARYDVQPFPPMESVPRPRWDLLDMKKYASLSLQFSRGCPFDCDFCNVTALFGHRPRIKTSAQVIAELDELWALGWRTSVFFVDDNFIGNKGYLKRELLPAIIEWQRSRRRGLSLYTEASINLSDDDELMSMMSRAGFDTVFVGLETPSEEALGACNKKQNQGRDLVEDIRKIQRAGLQVQGGFIVGFDTDTESIFQRQFEFIQRSGVVTAMVGILQAPVGTKLYARLQSAGRLRGAAGGNNTSVQTNIIPTMNLDTLVQGYRQLIHRLYTPSSYYRRVRTFLQEFKGPCVHEKISWARWRAMVGSMLRLGVVGRECIQYWKLMLWVLWCKRHLLPTAVSLAITGFHFRKVSQEIGIQSVSNTF